LSKPVRHFIVTSSSEITAFISRDGYWNCLSIDVGIDSGKTEIISIDAVESIGKDNKAKLFLALAVAEKIEQEKNEPHSAYSLRIYGNKPNTKPFLEQALFSIGETCQTIPLTSAPMQLSHIQIQHKTGFLLTSMDGIVHLFAQDENHEFAEQSSATFFPLMSKISNHRIKILFMHMLDQPNGKRVMCAGGQNGEIFLAFYDKDGKETKSHAIRIFSPITSVLVFQPRASTHPEDELHLVVTCAIEQAIVYQSIEKEGLDKSKTLPLSGNFDSVLCSHVMDVDWDGEKEILIGTYGRQVLIYKQVAGTQIYTVLWKRQLAYPIYRLTHLDLNRDGLDELVVTTMYGVHIFQPNMKKARERLLEVLQYVEASKRQKYELLIEWQRQKELEKQIVFEQ
ncbi:hypothetical protein CU098_009881, partial [Rhizopus stolonifer]